MSDRLLERFFRYVKIHTTSVEDSADQPSHPRQLDLSRILVEELTALGLSVRLDEFGYVYATLPDNLPASHSAKGKVPAIGFIAHVDTSPDAPGAGVDPQIVRNYQGGDVKLPKAPDQTIRVEEMPELDRQIGNDLITTDGTTLLGADDKAGVAEIMEAVHRLIEHPELLHGPIQIAFTPDEEIGRGTAKFDVPGFGASIAYTLDGSEEGRIEKETFNAHSATFTLKGYNVHPGTAKGKMVNALYAAADVIGRLPEGMRPETTEEREGYIHPRGIQGGIDHCTIRLLIRDFDMEGSKAKIKLLKQIRERVAERFPRVGIDLEFSESYLNMGPKVDENPRIVEIAFEACEAVGIKPFLKLIRGGTDGARLSYMGIPTPNIFTGGYNYHSVREWASLQEMEHATQVVMKIAQLWVGEADG